MSRSGGGAIAAAPTITNADGEEQCPICKTLRYLNKNMTFLINTCYHPLCNNCVDRIFENGPNQCPYVHCHLTLRKRQFREPTFADLNVEREVDIRRRVAQVFNQTQDDFEDLRAFNDHLDMVESLTMDLVYGDPAARAEADTKLKIWEDQHTAQIASSRRAGDRQREQTKKHLQAEQKAAAQRRQEAQRAEEAERVAKARQREADLDMLASAPVGSAHKVLLKKRGQERQEAALEREAAAVRRAAAAASGEFTIKGLKKKPDAAAIAAARKAADAAAGPYDPFGKLDLRPARYTLREKYSTAILDRASADTRLLVGGYRVAEYYSRALFDAFAGLAVFVVDEKDTGVVGLDLRGVATAEASMAAVESAMDGGAVDVKISASGATKRPASSRGDISSGKVAFAAAADRDGDVLMADASSAGSLPSSTTPKKIIIKEETV